MLKKIKVLLSLLILFFVGSVIAQEKVSNESFEQDMIDSNIAISDWLDNAAESIDLFIVGKRVTNRKNNTSIRIENGTYLTEGQTEKNATSVIVNLQLPNLEEYWQLKFTSYDENKEKSFSQRGDLRKAPREDNYGATLGLFRKLGDIRTAFQPRIDLRDPFKVSHSLSFESTADLNSYKVSPKIDFYANPDDGTGIFMQINVDLNLTNKFDFTFINDGDYKEKLHLLSVNNGFSIGHKVTNHASLAYSLIFNSISREEYHLHAYTASVSLNHLIYRNILSYSLTPYLSFGRSEDFRGIPGLSFIVALNF